MNFKQGNKVLSIRITAMYKKWLNNEAYSEREQRLRDYIDKIKLRIRNTEPITYREVQILELVKKQQDHWEQMGIYKAKNGTCPTGYNNCTFCACGHLTECHYPKTCAEAKCSHYQAEMEFYEQEPIKFGNEKWIREYVLCGVCQEPMKNSEALNLIQLNKRATWKSPQCFNYITGETGIAVSIICDSCCEMNVDPVFAIEYDKEQQKAIYHKISDLEDL